MIIKQEYLEVRLVPEEYTGSQQVSREIYEAIKRNSGLKISEYREMISHDIITRQVSHFIASEVLQEITARFPSNWWQAVKLRFFPHWLLKRYPVVMTRIDMVAKALYPKVQIPEEKHLIILRYVNNTYPFPDIKNDR